MAVLWPTEEPIFKKLSEEEIKRMNSAELEIQLRIDKRNRLNYRNKVVVYLSSIPLSWIFAIGLNLLVSPLYYVTTIIIFNVLFIWLSNRAYRKLVREVRPQVARLEKRIQELSSD